jgi:protein required for attachment to host cells
MKRGQMVVTADGTRARFFTLEESAEPAVASSPYLVERADIVNTEHRQPSRDKYSTTRTGFNADPGKGPHRYDDHRVRQEQEHERRFAYDIAVRALAMMEEFHADHLIVTAEKRMLGLLREVLNRPARSGVEIVELDKDLTRLPPQELQEQLAAYGVLPERRMPR